MIAKIAKEYESVGSVAITLSAGDSTSERGVLLVLSVECHVHWLRNRPEAKTRAIIRD
jgi:hypothetical protein